MKCVFSVSLIQCFNDIKTKLPGNEHYWVGFRKKYKKILVAPFFPKKIVKYDMMKSYMRVNWWWRWQTVDEGDWINDEVDM